MSKTNALENALLLLIFNAAAFADIAQNHSSPATNLYVALHVSDPGEANPQNSSECSYGSYARVAVVRTSSGWVVTNNSVSPAADVVFPTCTSGGETATHWSVGVGSSGATVMLYKGALNANIVISSGVVPRLSSTSTIVEE